MNLKNRIENKFNKDGYSYKMPFPKKNLLIEVTNYCNNQCIFCYNSCMKRPKRFIDKDICIKVLEDAYSLGMREVGFYVTGEPLLDNRLSYFISLAKNIGYEYIYITTNGILANLETVKKIYESGLNSIKYSINAYNEMDYLKVHKTNNFNRVINNLKEVYKWKENDARDLKVFVSYISINDTKNLEEINNTFSNICDEYIVMPAINQGGLMPGISEISSKGINDINSGIKLPCPYVFNSVVVTVEGYLTACCMDFENMLVYADLNKDSLKNSWNNEIIKNLRKKHLNNDINNTICNNCINNKLDIPKPLCKKLCYIKKIDKSIFINDIIKGVKNGSN